MIEVFVLQKAPVPLLHLTKKHMVIRQSAVFEINQVIIKRFQKILLLFIEITFKINNKFLKSRHISRNSIVEELHFFFRGYSDHAEQPVDGRKSEFLLRDQKYAAAVPHHLAYFHFPPFPAGIFTQGSNSSPDFLKVSGMM